MLSSSHKKSEVLLLHNNARAQTCAHHRGCYRFRMGSIAASTVWSSSKYHLFGSLTENLQGRHYANGKALQNAVPMSSGMRPTVESKAGPLQTQKGPEGSRKLRFPDYMTAAQDGGKVSLMHRPPLPPGNTLGTHFC